jgi:molybdopterin-containing oxidoreductase family iron-sulfur binding subunit
MSQKYWKSLEEKAVGAENVDSVKDVLDNKTSVQSLIQNELAGKTSSRRNFLKWCGFTFTSAAIATSCENPVKKAIPYLNKPEEITPGKANFYASSFFDGTEYGSILVKTREGRPIKIEPNELSAITKEGTSARSQAMVLSLYDADGRYHHPLKNQQKISWEEADEDIRQRLETLSASGKAIELVTPPIINPSARELIEAFTNKYKNVRWTVYEPVSASALLESNKLSFGRAVVPQYRFDNAGIIAAVNADFLGTWLSPVDYTGQYASGRKVDGEKKSMLRHLQFESVMSLTGTNADERHVLHPSEEGAFLAALYNALAKQTGNPTFASSASSLPVEETAQELLKHKGEALVVCGTNNVAHQVIVNAINHLLDAYGNTIDLDYPLMTRQATDEAFDNFVSRLQKGAAGAVIFHDVNPLYDYPKAGQLQKALAKAQLTVSTACTHNETGAKTEYTLPLHHPLEAWGDFEAVSGKYSLAQPAIRNIYDTRQFEDILLKWNNSSSEYQEYLKTYWKENMYPLQQEYGSFYDFWVHSLQKGVFEPEQAKKQQPPYSRKGLKSSITDARKTAPRGTALLFYEKVALGNGKHSNNPWLQELPDPVTKATWDNYFCISPDFAKKHQLDNEQVITIAGISLPVLIQPGQAKDTIAVALGYGRSNTGKVADGVGENAFPLLKTHKGHRQFYRDNVSYEAGNNTHPIATTQIHHTMEGREIVRETNLDTWINNPESIKQKKHDATLYPGHKYESHHWALIIDLNACTGCGACAIACQAENNVPVVGKEEVIKKRIMHWIRIDRYYKEDEDNPQVVHQPVMCQHCDNAPCENVCPVAATNHSNEGLNQMAYNRCIGTKYCINNCPYKVRRFNWYKYADNDEFDYNMNDDLGRMVLNPDVTVRSRGVVEKCSFCVQRIQENKEQAKLDNRKLQDGEITPACAQSCPSNALIFGDLNDPESRVSKLVESDRNYHLLEELHTKPTVSYLTKVRNMGAKTEA